jgi:hypothetical protein
MSTASCTQTGLPGRMIERGGGARVDPSAPIPTMLCWMSFVTTLCAHREKHTRQRDAMTRRCNNAGPNRGGMQRPARAVSVLLMFSMLPRDAVQTSMGAARRAEGLQLGFCAPAGTVRSACSPILAGNHGFMSRTFVSTVPSGVQITPIPVSRWQA